MTGLKYLIIFIFSLNFSCKSREESSNLSFAEPGSSLNSQPYSQDFDDKYAKICSEKEFAHCKTPLIQNMCGANAEKVDRAVFYLLGNSETEFAFKDETIRPLLASYVDGKVRQDVTNCFAEAKERTALTTDDFTDFNSWLTSELARDLKSDANIETSIVRNIAQRSCLLGGQGIAQMSLDHPENHSCLKVTEYLNRTFTDHSSATAFCRSLENEQKASLDSLSRENYSVFLDNYFKEGFSQACFKESNEVVCDFIHKTFEILAAQLKQTNDDFRNCHLPYFGHEKNVESNESRLKIRKSSEMNAKWLVSSCCYCQQGYYQKEFELSGEIPMKDELLGVVNFLQDAKANQNELPEACKGAMPSIRINMSSTSNLFDYTYVTDCSFVSVVGPSCPFLPGEEKRRLWKDGEPSNQFILSPFFDLERAPRFITHNDQP